MKKQFFLDVRGLSLEEKVRSFLKDLLEKKIIRTLLAPRQVPSGDGVTPALIVSEDNLDKVDIFAPAVPLSMAKVVSFLTKNGPANMPVGVVLRSCEARALFELVKLKQACLDNLLLIGLDCLGTYSIRHYKKISLEGASAWEVLFGKFKREEEDENLRTSCKICEYPVCFNTDLNFGIIGVDREEGILIEALSQKGEKVLESFSLSELKEEEKEKREKVVSEYIKERCKKREQFFLSLQEKIKGWENLSSFFSTCINCHNCMRACPICYCRECFFESPTFEFDFTKHLLLAEKRGSVKMPRDVLLFHLGRMSHISCSCVGCGLCEQACPSDIPLSGVFKMVSQNAQKIFDYLPGRSLEEPLPLTTFREDELQQVGED
ncbi:Coenzyme F420 hydrogenase/dehydrogenase, beta subunit C-terminal domain [Candidatus Aerophobetes bacterium]|nr:Coenzyme F420 hydrogenase/dehydrogenase, beta subunit C-terminal domain [Candidatus Aerophobetes bacterium]